MEVFLLCLKKQNTLITDFAPLLLMSLVEYVDAKDKDDVHFIFKNGSTI